eukprot:5556368-Amphidinium_carterae.1
MALQYSADNSITVAISAACNNRGSFTHLSTEPKPTQWVDQAPLLSCHVVLFCPQTSESTKTFAVSISVPLKSIHRDVSSFECGISIGE